jgi:peptidoglycan/xylan/chitin deacetylase (PgdA/CDA1 family)
MNQMTRRQMIERSGSLALGTFMASNSYGQDKSRKAQIVISLDLEMSREFPTRDQMHWDYEKGNLDEPTKRYAVEAARLVKNGGGLVHFFALGRTMEQPDVSWLKGIMDEGHAVGNHSYDHIYLLAKTVEELQFRFKRAPWLLEGRSVAQEIEHNILIAEKAFKSRLNLQRPDGFRTPGGFQTGLHGREDLQKMLLNMGYKYVSSVYPAHANTKVGVRPDESVFQSIVESQMKAQPFKYPSGLIEIPMSPISDIGSFRNGRWPLEDFMEAVRRGLESVIEKGGVYDFLAHPSCLVVSDPGMKTLKMILKIVAENQEKAEILTLGNIANSM